MRHLLSLADVTAAEVETIFAITEDLKSKNAKGLREPLLPGRVMAMLFEKPSLRTRASFEAAMIHLGGGTLFLGPEAGFGQRESISDFSRVLSEYVDVIVVRAFRHATIEEVAAHASCSVINGLTDLAHPCQALADFYTMREHFQDTAGRTLAFVGDCNNMARSLAAGCGKLGMEMIIACPPKYQFDAAFLDSLRNDTPDIRLTLTDDPVAAVRRADVVYTDVWVSMGQEQEAPERKKAFRKYQVNEELFANAPEEAIFMHCLPAHRGEEVTDGVIDGPRSAVVRQAGNRLHVQKGVLAWTLAAHA